MYAIEWRAATKRYGHRTALDALHAQGFDATVDVKESATCQDLCRNQASVCSTMADGLAKSIAGQLQMAGSAELDAFQSSVSALGFGLCPVIP